MQAKEASERLGITQRMLRHYEKQDLMSVGRTLNGYRRYSECDLRRAGRIRDFIATGFSTREIRAMSACLSDDGSGPCEGGIEKMLEKLEHIERLRADLDDRRAAVLERLAVFKNGISSSEDSVETMETTTDSFVRRETPADLGAAGPR
ncbi:MerR family DNA-binding transcriptional regulator [Octadecabacter sp. 1_MG-2023]|uniref:MerR family transcriptional regulator n=1 Tax=unclassified Octadecabacter TaxID=196158 RepID=UPI001C091B0E|nr:MULTISPECIES: MerR family transcriptional regulator [unclassified Octadecabacter]MBU2994480.1 MerR family transcriptional regulator [Octadecabacter sp. B2R22]MDO6734229.1 MerR family DNA-binding transcriptional regulator [Octadecabacter sp. 1_MG-2023]